MPGTLGQHREFLDEDHMITYVFNQIASQFGTALRNALTALQQNKASRPAVLAITYC
jgi:hypothetical protein